MGCIVCGNTNYVVNTEKFSKDFCSYKRYEEWRKRNSPPNCYCEVCGKPVYMKPYRLERVKNGITCSKECSNKLREKFMSGKNNHQYGLIGDKNSSFGGEELMSEFGYILVYCPGHPFPHDKTDKCTRVFKHRLVIEENYQLFDAKYFIEGKFYLRPEYVVHHINEIKDDNRLENLQILTVSEHIKLHNLRKEIIRDLSSGRKLASINWIISVKVLEKKIPRRMFNLLYSIEGAITLPRVSNPKLGKIYAELYSDI